MNARVAVITVTLEAAQKLINEHAYRLMEKHDEAHEHTLQARVELAKALELLREAGSA